MDGGSGGSWGSCEVLRQFNYGCAGCPPGYTTDPTSVTVTVTDPTSGEQQQINASICDPPEDQPDSPAFICCPSVPNWNVQAGDRITVNLNNGVSWTGVMLSDGTNMFLCASITKTQQIHPD